MVRSSTGESVRVLCALGMSTNSLLNRDTNNYSPAGKKVLSRRPLLSLLPATRLIEPCLLSLRFGYQLFFHYIDVSFFPLSQTHKKLLFISLCPVKNEEKIVTWKVFWGGKKRNCNNKSVDNNWMAKGSRDGVRFSSKCAEPAVPVWTKKFIRDPAGVQRNRRRVNVWYKRRAGTIRCSGKNDRRVKPDLAPQRLLRFHVLEKSWLRCMSRGIHGEKWLSELLQ